MITRLAVIVLGSLLWAPTFAQTLEDRVGELERRLDRLEKQVAQSNAPATTSKPASTQNDGLRYQDKWRSLRRGMSERDVRSILGEPNKVDVNAIYTRWDYSGGGKVQFSALDGRLQGWTEPR